MNGWVAAVIMVLGASVSPRTADLQVEAVTTTGSYLPDLADAVARALVIGGARVVMRGPTTVPCEDCTRVKVTESSAGIYKIEVNEQDRLTATTLDLSAGTRLLDRARAIAIQTRLLIGRPSGSASKVPDGTALPARKSEAKPVRANRQSQVAALPASAEIPSARPPEPLFVPASAPETPMPSWGPAPTALSAPAQTRTVRVESKAPSRALEASPPAPTAVKVAEPKRPASATQDTSEAAAPHTAPKILAPDLVASSATARPKWPWIPMTVGAAAGIGAGICALIARNRYDGLSDKNQPLDSALSLRSSGEDWQLASYILSGVAAAGLGVGIVSLATASSGGRRMKASVAPMRNGGMAIMAWELP
jgi:hypothetical protein